MIFSILLYVIVWTLLFWSFMYWWSLPWIFLWILAPSFLVAKDFFVFGNGWVVWAVPHVMIDWKQIDSDVGAKKIPWRYPVVLLVRKYCFPLFLMLYLVYVLIDTTKIRNLHVSTFFMVMNESFLLFMTMVSWIVMLFWEQYDKQYILKEKSKKLWVLYIILIYFLSALGWYIVLQQVIELWVVGMMIGNIVVLLLFFVGLLLLEEE